MSLLATNPNQQLTQAPDLPGNDPTPSPLASPAEAVFALFPSDSGTIEYLFGGGLMDAVATPLEDVPVLSPDLGATAMSSVNEGVNAHVSAMPDIPTPVAGGETNVPLAEPTVAAAPSQSTLKATLVAEGGRLKSLIARLGGPSASASGGSGG
jgi:hypothetical protein